MDPLVTGVNTRETADPAKFLGSVQLQVFVPHKEHLGLIGILQPSFHVFVPSHEIRQSPKLLVAAHLDRLDAGEPIPERDDDIPTVSKQVDHLAVVRPGQSMRLEEHRRREGKIVLCEVNIGNQVLHDRIRRLATIAAETDAREEVLNPGMS